MTSSIDDGLTSKITRASVALIAFSASLFHLYTLGFGSFSMMVQRPMHWFFMSTLIFLLYPFKRKGKISIIGNWVPAILSATTCLYIAVNSLALAERAGAPNRTDIVLGVLATLLVLEAGRRVLSLFFTLMAACFIGYAYFGPYMPGEFAHRGYDLFRIADMLYLGGEGLFGIPMNVSATYIAGFVLFGAVLSTCGISKVFVDVATAATAKTRGGTAKAAVVGSALFGLVSGGAAANVVVSGTFTIPLMKRSGYKPSFAGAVEAAASSGGQIMPPVMGAGAFLIAEFLQVPYLSVIKAALLPACLYYLSLFVATHLYAVKNINVTENTRTDFSIIGVLKSQGLMLSPIPVMIGFIILGYSPFKAVFWSILIAPLTAWIVNRKPPGLKLLVDSLISAAKSLLPLAAACAIAGILVGMLSLTGLGMIFSSAIRSLSGGNIIIALLITMTSCILLGMGMPTTAAYIVVATLGAPALMDMGIEPLMSHLFVFYFACMAPITPPVALASYAAAAIAETEPWEVGWSGLRMGIAGFIVPFMFVFSPSLLLRGDIYHIIWSTITAVVGIWLLVAGIQGYWSMWLRILFFVSSFFLLHGGIYTDVLGILFGGIPLAWVMLKERAKPAVKVSANLKETEKHALDGYPK